MADAKIVDIKGVQWELKDEVARNNILNLQNKNEEITAEVNNVKKTTFSTLLGRNTNIVPNAKWVKISGLYSGQYYNDNIFLITSRRGQTIILVCPIDDNNIKSTPVAISLWDGINKISNIVYKDGDIYMYSLGWSGLRINQISGDKVEVKITDETPPSDVVDITINKIQFKEQSTN